ncbi:copper amine oxidase N-terminal domain-containing protein [Paenibacillus roseipurpureus]|uniref:Copper amine oxidase N-terminal domain-containing protein n=1 Tax=Paenibacillus roseopurpureus TaxID=2918901 RepID=A0AA96RN24_9BACL|nr:copper amine oxidase N-terminal domain-containing protein [Paenibacillus sp. MBLB1832]WNR44947.1 copper amine oxidase N-terminal domain-containing protein [Paenibacillus sp. MBLB1832]
MNTKKWTWLISTALVIMLLTLTGCQSVEGLNLAKAIQNDWSVKSSESKSTVQLEFVSGDTSKLTAEEKAALVALQNVKIELAVKTQDSQRLSADGTIIYSKGKIPFKVATEGTKIALSIEGAKKPIVIDLLGGANISFLNLLPKALKEQFGNKLLEIKPSLIGLILGNAPDPAHLTVTPVTDSVNGESLSLQKAHLAFSGSELASLLQKLLANVVADEAGLKEVLGQLYDALEPVIKEQIAGGDSSITLQLLTNKDVTLGLVYSPIHDYLADLAESLTTTLTGGGSSEGVLLPTKDLFSSNASLQADIYTDGDKQVRKQSLAVNLPLSDTKTGVSAVKLTLTSETWNLNKPVTASTIDTTGALQLGLNATSTFKLLANLDKQSTFYGMLKNDLRVTKKDINMKTDGSGGDADVPQPFIDGNGKTMVPVRFVSETLGAEVGWNGDLRQVTITDYLTGRTILLTLDSTHATVNGSAVPELESAATLSNNSTFVPIRFIAETLGCVVSFNDSTRVVTIHRD